MSKKAIICGVGGQDGAYLAKNLLEKGYQVFGTSRDMEGASLRNLEKLKIRDRVKLYSMDISDFRSVLNIANKVMPNEIYNLAGQTSVGLSFDQPVEAMESISGGTLRILEVIRFLDPKIRFYNASSSDCFGDTGNTVADEDTPFYPRSPYAVAKSSAHFLVRNYRDAYGLHASSGILFNHESPLRPQRFVTQKIISYVCALKQGIGKKLHLGNLSISRDWGWAPDYVEAMWRMLQQDNPDDYVIATGKTISLEQFVDKAFSYFGFNWKDHVEIDHHLTRPSDISISRGNPSKALKVLGWAASKDVDGVIEGMIESSIRNLDSK